MKLLRNHKNKKNIKSHVIMISKKKKKSDYVNEF